MMTVGVFGADRGFSPRDRRQWGRVPVVPYRAYGPMATSVQLRRLLAAANADLAHQHGIWLDDQWASLQWCERSARPLVVSPHGMLDSWALANSAWKKRLAGMVFAKRSLGRAACIHVLCRSEVESIRSFGLTNPIALIPNGVELPEISSSAHLCGEKILLFLGRIRPKKGLEGLIKAWPDASRGWKLVVAGWDDGGHEVDLRSLVVRLGKSDSVEFVGPKLGAEKDALFRCSSAFILPSFSEGLPVAVLEAWSYGLPVLMTDACNLPEGSAANAAIRISPDSSSISQELEVLFDLTEDGRVAMGGSGRRLVEEKFTWPRIASSMKQVYEWCVGGGAPPESVVR